MYSCYCSVILQSDTAKLCNGDMRTHSSVHVCVRYMHKNVVFYNNFCLICSVIHNKYIYIYIYICVCIILYSYMHIYNMYIYI